MRALRLETKIASVCAFAAALVAVMGLPWFGPAPRPVLADGSTGAPRGALEDLSGALPRWLGEFDDGSSAWRLFAHADLVLVGLAATAAVCALLCLPSATEQVARGVLPVPALGALAIILVTFVNPPGDNLLWEPRYGLFTAMACALMLVASAFGIRQTGLRSGRRRALAPVVALRTPIYDPRESKAPPWRP